MQLTLESLELDRAFRSLCRATIDATRSYRAAASQLGITQTALARYLEKYAIPWPPSDASAEPEQTAGDDAGDGIEVSESTLAGLERALCIQALARIGHVRGAADLLGISEHALKRRMIVHRINLEMLPAR